MMGGWVGERCCEFGSSGVSLFFCVPEKNSECAECTSSIVSLLCPFQTPVIEVKEFTLTSVESPQNRKETANKTETHPGAPATQLTSRAQAVHSDLSGTRVSRSRPCIPRHLPTFPSPRCEEMDVTATGRLFD